jgi:hypothetical protein
VPSKAIVYSSLTEQESGVVEIRHVETPVVTTRRVSSSVRVKLDRQVHNTVGDRLAVDQSVVRVLVYVGLGEREFVPHREVSTRRRRSPCRNQQVIHRRGLVAVDERPQRSRVVLVASIHITSIGHLESLERPPDKRVHRTTLTVLITSEPAVNCLDLTRTETSQHNLLSVARGDYRDDLLLLDELARESISVSAHIHTTSKSITLVVHNDLLDDERGSRESGRRGRGTANRVHSVDRGDGVEFYRNLNLLGEEVSGERVSLANTRGDAVREGENNRGILVYR